MADEQNKIDKEKLEKFKLGTKNTEELKPNDSSKVKEESDDKPKKNIILEKKEEIKMSTLANMSRELADKASLLVKEYSGKKGYNPFMVISQKYNPLLAEINTHAGKNPSVEVMQSLESRCRELLEGDSEAQCKVYVAEDKGLFANNPNATKG